MVPGADSSASPAPDEGQCWAHRPGVPHWDEHARPCTENFAGGASEVAEDVDFEVVLANAQRERSKFCWWPEEAESEEKDIEGAVRSSVCFAVLAFILLSNLRRSFLPGPRLEVVTKLPGKRETIAATFHNRADDAKPACP